MRPNRSSTHWKQYDCSQRWHIANVLEVSLMTCSTDMTSLPLKPKQCCFLSNTLRRATIVSASGLIVALRRHCRHRVFRQRTQPCRRVLVPGEVQQQLHSITQQPSVRHISKGMNSGPSRSSTRMRASSVSRNSFLLAEMAVLQGSQEDSKSERALSLQAQPAHRRIGRTQLSPLGHSPKNFFSQRQQNKSEHPGQAWALARSLRLQKHRTHLSFLSPLVRILLPPLLYHHRQLPQ